MTLRDREREMPAETGELGRRLLAPGDPYRVIGEQLAEVVRDGDFAELYEPTGRAAIPPSVLALVTVFQFLEGLPDRQAARAVATRLDWKYALRLPLGDQGFDFTVLHYFRDRVLAGGAEALLFEAVLGKVRTLGLLKQRKQRTDATGVAAAVRELTQLETATEALRLAVRAIEAADPGWARAQLPPGYRERHARTVPEYRLTEAERAAALREAAEDGSWLLGRLAEAPTGLRDLEAVGVLATVWAQRFERGPDGATRPRADGGVACTERIISPHDPGARAGRKRGRGWVGEKVHVTETADPDGPNFLTDVATENAAGHDTAALPGIRVRLAERGLSPDEQVVDAGYVSGKPLAESEAAGVELVGPPPEDSSANGFKLADFAFDHERRVAVCPAGVRSEKWAVRTSGMAARRSRSASQPRPARPAHCGRAAPRQRRAEPEPERALRAAGGPPGRGAHAGLPGTAEGAGGGRGDALGAGAGPRPAATPLPRRGQAPLREPAERGRLQPQAARPGPGRPRAPGRRGRERLRAAPGAAPRAS